MSEYVLAEWATLLLNGVESLTDLNLPLFSPPLDPPVATYGDLPRGAFVFRDPQFRTPLWPEGGGEGRLRENLDCEDAIAISALPISHLTDDRLPSPRRLRLCKRTTRDDDDDEINHILHNLQLERATLESWASLLCHGRRKLEEIVFDLRPVTGEIWLDIMEAEIRCRSTRTGSQVIRGSGRWCLARYF